MNKEVNVSFFLPTRMGSQRVKNKNTRKFSRFEGGVFELKLLQLRESKKIQEIIISTNDPECIQIAEKARLIDNRIKIIERPNHLCLDETNLEDLIEYVSTLTELDHILWGHATTPMVDSQVYDEAISCYFKEIKNGYDSLVGVSKIQNFILNNSGEIINNTSDQKWPRTQDLEPIFEINHAVFLTSKKIYRSDKNRLGSFPKLFVIDKIISCDIDWEEDFLMAESLYEKFGKF
jgi:CMP-N-acetylneuraminic acid synthetase